jgi:hypothetical protein
MANASKIDTGTTALNPAKVTTTAAEAATIERRAPTPAEALATDTDAELEALLDKAETLEAYVNRLGVSAVGAHDKTTWRGIVAIAMRLVIKQARVTAHNSFYIPSEDDAVFQQFYLEVAKSGRMVWRDVDGKTASMDAVAAIVAETDAAKQTKLIREYVYEFGTGANKAKGAKSRQPVKTIATLKQDATRLATWFRDNMPVVVAEVNSLRQSPADAYALFRDEVIKNFTATASTLCSRLEAKYGTKRGTKAPELDGTKRIKAKETATDETVTAPATATSPVALLTAPVAEAAAPAAPVAVAPAAPLTTDQMFSAIFDMVETMDDDTFANLYRRMFDENAARREAREAAALEAMRVEAETKAREAAEAAAQVLAVEVALAGDAPAPKAKRNRKLITAKAA